MSGSSCTVFFISIFYMNINAMDRESYRRGWEDCIELVMSELRRKKLLSREVEEILLKIYAALKDDKIDELRRQLGIL